MNTRPNSRFVTMMVIMIALIGGAAQGQLDDRFGAKGVEVTRYLGQKGLNWYRDWEDSYLPANYPPAEKNKLWTVGKIDYRTDNLGMDYRWIVLDLLEDTDVCLLQSVLDLGLAIVDTNIVPVINDYWTKNKPILETQLEDTLNQFVYTEKIFGVKYRAKCKNTQIVFQDSLPEFILTVQGDSIILKTSIKADWKTHIYIEAWVLNPNPFHWGYYWQDVGDADCDFLTTVYLTGFIALEGQGRDRHLQVKQIVPDSRTESDIDWSVFGISFKWEGLSNSIEDLVDDELEEAMGKELNKPPITDPYYFIDFFKPLFSKGIVPTQQEILDRIWDEEQRHIIRVIKSEGYEGGYWSIGYEPNWYPMLDPEQYADFYVKYYRLIKKLDPNARVLGPPILLTEAMENFEDIAWLFIPDIFQGALAGIRDEFKHLIHCYFELADSKTWLRKFLDRLPADVKVDVNDFHVFPISSEVQTIDWDSLSFFMDDLANFMRAATQVDEVWVSEFGNIDRKRSEEQVAEMCRGFCQYFKSNTVGIQRWFWFLSRGHSPFYDIPFAPNPPATALLKNDFSMTPIGKAYLYEADNTPPIMVAVPTDEGKYAIPGKITFNWRPANEFDTGIADYRLEVKAQPGNVAIFSDWVGNQLSHTITCNDAGKTLYARVRAKNGAGLIGEWSGWSDGITIISADPKALEITDGMTSDSGSDQKTSFDGLIDDEEALAEANIQLAMGSAPTEVPTSIALAQNYPNPFNSSTAINYQLPEADQVAIKIYNARGELVRTLLEDYQTAGYHSVIWDGRDPAGKHVVSGIYLYRIQLKNYIATKKMIFVE